MDVSSNNAALGEGDRNLTHALTALHDFQLEAVEGARHEDSLTSCCTCGCGACSCACGGDCGS